MKNNIIEFRKKVVINKRCSCGKFHVYLPDNHKVSNNGDICDGIWFDCECRSTMFIPKNPIKKYGRAA